MKSHFKFTKKQQSGILFLLLLIALIQSIYFFVDFPSKEITYDNNELDKFQKEIDSLKLLEVKKKKPKIFPFNPNYISDYKGYALGMSNEEIDRLLTYREQNKWVNSAKQFQDVTKVSDSLLNAISPYFKFPEWVTNPKSSSQKNTSYYNTPKTYAQKLDLNKASAQQLQRINGIGEKLSKRIVSFRDKFSGGFIADIQLHDVYGLSPEVIERVKEKFTVKTPRNIKKINLNEANSDELVKIQHIDYELAYAIIEYRKLIDGYNSFNQLLKVKNFPANKIEIIELYLTLD